MRKKVYARNKSIVFKKPYLALLINLMFNFISVHLRLKLFRPLMTNVYITKRCNLRCLYCYPPGNEDDMNTELGLHLLEKIRPKNPAINFTGGEPLMHPHLCLFLEKAIELNFSPIIVSTNAYKIDKLIDLLPLIDNLIISLDSMDESIGDTLSAISGSTSTIIDNIKILSDLRKKYEFNITLHSVICESNIHEIEKLVDFCDRLKMTLSLSPEHVGVYPHTALINNGEYATGLKKLKQLKKDGKPIACSMNYLRKIEKFSKHNCFPFFSPRVEPDGSVYFPCYQIRKQTCNLKDHDSLYKLMRKKSNWKTKDQDCYRRCFLACYMEVEQYVKNPFSLIKEIPFRNLTLGHRIKLAK